jgi:hypothetical protein
MGDSKLFYMTIFFRSFSRMLVPALQTSFAYQLSWKCDFFSFMAFAKSFSILGNSLAEVQPPVFCSPRFLA